MAPYIMHDYLPTEDPGTEKVDLVVATAISQVATIWQPAAAATPSTLAMTGTGQCTISSIKSLQL